MKFRTESGSEYEYGDGRIRRANAKGGGGRMRDGEWHPAVDVYVSFGRRAIISWPSGQSTITTKVVEMMP